MTIENIDISFQDPLRSTPVQTNFDVAFTAINDMQNQVDAINTPASGSEVTNARDYHGSLRDRIRSGDKTSTHTIITGLAVTESATPDMYINVSDGEAIIAGVGIDKTSISPILITAPTLAHQLQVVVIDYDNTVSVIEGTEHATNYLMPTLTSTQKPIALLVLGSGTTSINEGTELFDARDQGCWYRQDGRLKFEFYIQDAIDDLPNGGIINIGNGNYYESLTYDDNQTLIFDNNVTLYDLTATEINYDEIDISAKTNTLIKFANGINRSGYNPRNWYNISIEPLENIMMHQIGARTAIYTATNPASICSLSQNSIAAVFYQGLEKYSWYGDGFTKIGNTFNIGTSSTYEITAMGENSVAIYNASTQTLGKYDFNGTNWALDGSALSLGYAVVDEIACIDTNRVVVADATNSYLKVYDHDGSNFSLTGNAYDNSGYFAGSVTRIATNKFVYRSSDTINFSFDGTDISPYGNATPTSGTPLVISENIMMAIANNVDNIYIYKYKNNTWTLTATNSLPFDVGSNTSWTIVDKDIVIVRESDSAYTYAFKVNTSINSLPLFDF